MNDRFGPVADAIRAGNKFEAVRQLRLITGMGLSEANAAVEQLERENAASERKAPGGSEMNAAYERSSPRESETLAASEPSTPGVSGTFAASVASDFAALRSPRDPGVVPLAGDLADSVEALVREHRYLEAIKLVQSRTGGDLKTAHDQVYLLMDQRGIVRPKSSAWRFVAIAIIFLALGIIVAVATFLG